MLHVSRKHRGSRRRYRETYLAGLYGSRYAEGNRPERERRENLGTVGSSSLVVTNSGYREESALCGHGSELLAATDQYQRCHHRLRYEFWPSPLVAPVHPGRYL